MSAAATQPKRRKTQSATFEDDDDSARGESAQPEDGPTDGTSTQARKAQNRLAQREFRQRKQQYIRDLEARVEIMSGGSEERIELMVLVIRNLLKENKDLRGLVQSMASFVGEGLGSCLPRLGLSAPELDDILNRADTDSAYEVFAKLQASRDLAEANPGIPMGDVKHRNPSTTSKRKRGSVDQASKGLGKNTDHTPDNDAETPDSAHRTSKEDKNLNPSETLEQTMADYAYLFPEIDNLQPGPSRYSYTPNPSYQQPMGNMYQQNAFPTYNPPSSQYTNQPVITPNTLFGTNGPSPPFNMNPMGDFSGFGLTVPASYFPGQNSQSSTQNNTPTTYPNMNSLNSNPNPNPSLNPPPNIIPPHNTPQGAPSYQQYQQPAPTTSVVTTTTTTVSPNPPNSSTPDHTEIERQKRLRIAVRNLTSKSIGEGTMDDPDMSLEEVERQHRMTQEIRDRISKEVKTDNRMEAMQLFSYHLNNFRLNHSYVLPPSLRPSRVQRTIPHEHAIDSIVFPSMRDRMIVLRGRYDLVDAFQGLIRESSLHGDDVLDHHSWEVSEKWLKDFRLLADDEVYAICNKWRATRGENPLVRPASGAEAGFAALTQPRVPDLM